MKKSDKKNVFMEVFDSLFIMLLCFATLLSAMLIKGSGEGGIDYTLKVGSLAITAAVLLVYLLFVAKQSDKGLKTMISKLFDKESMR
ncbi:hypothetical protein E9840_01395 [Tissierella creatinini]|nr:hypothetical protein E9840_01395 [Tissierella creatinini]TJX64158.1 hypothetical protein E8P77_12955 [Soehngenia saccharolytica]